MLSGAAKWRQGSKLLNPLQNLSEKAVGHYSEASCSSLSKPTKPERSNVEASKQASKQASTNGYL